MPSLFNQVRIMYNKRDRCDKYRKVSSCLIGAEQDALGVLGPRAEVAKWRFLEHICTRSSVILLLIDKLGTTKLVSC